MISSDNNGGRTIHLFIPFDFGGKRIEAIALAPLRFGHVIRWHEGAWKTMTELLTELAGVEESVIRELRYPDADRVMEAFMALLTPELRHDIINDNIPQKPPPPVEQPDLVDEDRANIIAEHVNGGYERRQQGPGDPLPPIDKNPGFDLSEEP